MGKNASLDSASIDVLLARVPRAVKDTLTIEQKQGIANAMREVAWRKHPVDMRLSIPFFSRRFYFTMIAGEEQRSSERRKIEQNLRPVRTMGNMMFILGIAAVFYLFAIFGIFFYSQVLEY
ncbi:MAG: hypothetical protein HQL33_06315 [Alphaproteobacteria bacterium]|nr:hypothetical protein [Alphaproteobacteria bacterium]